MLEAFLKIKGCYKWWLMNTHATHVQSLRKSLQIRHAQRKTLHKPGIPFGGNQSQFGVTFCVEPTRVFCLTECLLFSCRVRGGLLARLSVIDYRASLPRSLGERLFLPIGFTMIGITAGIVYWQTDTPLRIMTAYCGSSIPSLLFLCSVVFNRITRSLEVSADPRSQSSQNGARQLRAQNRRHEVILLPW